MTKRTRLSIEALEDRLVPSAQPNFVFILTDDQDTETLQYMPRLQELLADQGTTFENAFVTNPVCCPSNVSILTGQYSHNNQILHNVPPLGGFQKFVDMGTDGNPATHGDENTLATWLHDAGYLTGRVGKYLVGYPVGSTYIPPGWDEWHQQLRRVLQLLQLPPERERHGRPLRRQRGGLPHRRADPEGRRVHRRRRSDRRPAVLPLLRPERPARRARPPTARRRRPRATSACSPGRRPRARRRSTRPT